MKIAIHQPNFLPWIGYFHKIAHVNKFVFFDDVQLPRGKSFCSRTKILINGKVSWLTIPILNKSNKNLIKDVKVDNNINWKKKHLRTIELNYSKAKFFDDFFPLMEKIYNNKSEYLIDYNILLIVEIAGMLELNTKFYVSSEILPSSSAKGLERILEINKFLDSDIYLSGSGRGSKRYIKKYIFNENGIKLEWQDFSPFEYNQLGINEFVPNLSIIDLIFNMGKESGKLLKQNYELKKIR